MIHLNSHRAGFSFTEVIIVVLVIGILTAAAVPRFQDSISRHSLDSACQRLVADFEFAKSNAAARSNVTTIKFFEAAADTYVFPNVPSRSHPDEDYQVDLSVHPYRSQVESAVFAGESEISFNGYGVPDSAGVVTLTIGGKYRQSVSVSSSGAVTIGAIAPINPSPDDVQTQEHEITPAF